MSAALVRPKVAAYPRAPRRRSNPPNRGAWPQTRFEHVAESNPVDGSGPRCVRLKVAAALAALAAFNVGDYFAGAVNHLVPIGLGSVARLERWMEY